MQDVTRELPTHRLTSVSGNARPDPDVPGSIFEIVVEPRVSYVVDDVSQFLTDFKENSIRVRGVQRPARNLWHQVM